MFFWLEGRPSRNSFGTRNSTQVSSCVADNHCVGTTLRVITGVVLFPICKAVLCVLLVLQLIGDWLMISQHPNGFKLRTQIILNRSNFYFERIVDQNRESNSAPKPQPWFARRVDSDLIHRADTFQQMYKLFLIQKCVQSRGTRTVPEPSEGRGLGARTLRAPPSELSDACRLSHSTLSFMRVYV